VREQPKYDDRATNLFTVQREITLTQNLRITCFHEMHELKKPSADYLIICLQNHKNDLIFGVV